jgi:DNA-binding beta-propeller fold protein YncE
MHRPRRDDERPGRIAYNVLYRALSRPLPTALRRPPRVSEPPAIGPFAQTVRLFAGKPLDAGDGDAVPPDAQLINPLGIAALPSGELAVADGGKRRIQIVDVRGGVRAMPMASLEQPVGVAADASGRPYVSDSGKHTILRVDPDGKETLLAGKEQSPGLVDGSGETARFRWPAGIALSPDQRSLFVADLGNRAVRQIALDDAAYPVHTVTRGLLFPSAVALDARGGLFVVESGKSRIVTVEAGRIKPVAGSGTPGFRDGPAALAQFRPQFGLAALSDGSLLVADTGNYRVRRIANGTVSTLAGSGRFGVRVGSGDQADVVLPTGLAIGADNSVYVAEGAQGAVLVILP